MKFTDNYIKNLQPDKTWFEKTEATGLGVRVLPSGNKSWVYRFTFNSKRYKMTLGKYPGISLKQARELHIAAIKLKEQGINPITDAEEQKRKQNDTVKHLVMSWYKNYIEKHRKQPLQIKQHIEADIIPSLGDLSLSTIQAWHITKALDAIVARGARVHANKVLSTLKQAFNYAVSRGELAANPAIHIRSRDIGGIEKPRDRFLTIDEIKTLWLFLDSEENRISFSVKAAIKIILLTGVRTAELRLAQWSEINFEAALWTIPAQHTKSNQVMHIHLSVQTMALFAALKSCTTSKYVITGFDDEQPLTEKALPRAVNRVQERLGIPHWTAHDLRRTFATQMGQTLHVDPVVIEKCLGHKMPKIMATYNKNEMLPQRKDALNRWGEFLENLLSTRIIHPSNSHQITTHSEAIA